MTLMLFFPLSQRCGHIGCEQRAHLPVLGGGHSKCHFQTTHIGNASTAGTRNHGGKKKRVKILRILCSSSKGCLSNDAVVVNSDDTSESNSSVLNESLGGHEVCIDIPIVMHGDDYVLSDVPWLASLQEELNVIELQRDELDHSFC
ncbi:hypothetical protein HJC23_007985 [Cyclotella cryptica]|uniref:Uncharacterized protein n=1 Tax=Cyclotella cryptica TaxID=29204 RepID=A0ABD3P6S0_9STRA